MNRPIKFRAWSGGRMTQLFFIRATGKVSWGEYSDANNPVEVPVMQFTGLLDKNGKEIYEGDVVQVFVAGSDEETPAYTVTINDIRDGYVGVGNGCGEVIGNIYENAELLKV